MGIIDILLLLISLLFWLSGFWFIYKIPLCQKSNANNKYPVISIIIPARNEEQNIGILLDSINNQDFKVDEIIVVNDSSTDKTEELALSKNAFVINSKKLPKGWLGKPWVCFQGANYAKGEVLIFLDADTKIEPGGLRKIVDTFLENSREKKIVVSISPFHKVKQFYEEFSLFFNIIMTGSMGAFTPLSGKGAKGLFGQSLIVHREDYFLIGGHEVVKDKILENVFMSEKFLNAGIGLRCYGGKSSLSFRMYPDGFKSLVNGWTKAFASGASRTSVVNLINIILWISAGFTITISFFYNLIINNNLVIWGMLYLLYASQLFWMAKRIGDFRLSTCLLFPIQLIFYCAVFTRSSYYQKTKKSIKWKSREVNG